MLTLDVQYFLREEIGDVVLTPFPVVFNELLRVSVDILELTLVAYAPNHVLVEFFGGVGSE